MHYAPALLLNTKTRTRTRTRPQFETKLTLSVPCEPGTARMSDNAAVLAQINVLMGSLSPQDKHTLLSPPIVSAAVTPPQVYYT